MMQPGALITVVAGMENSGLVILRAKLTGFFHNDGSLDVRLIGCEWASTATLKPENEGITWLRGWGERQEAILAGHTGVAGAGAVKPAVGEEITAILDGTLTTDGSPLVIRGRVTDVAGWAAGDFQVQGVEGFDMRDFVNEAEEGVMWLHGWGDEIEAALRAAHALADRVPLRPTPTKNESPKAYEARWAAFNHYKIAP
jgi:hypothetical protein